MRQSSNDDRRQSERAWDGTASHARVLTADRALIDSLINDILKESADGVIVLHMDDRMEHNPPTPRTLADRSRRNDKGDRFAGMDGIHSAIDGPPNFLKFWAKLNDERNREGFDDALYAEAKEAFQGGPTPEGALTFIGKKWDGLRAIPKPNSVYHGEFRLKQPDGSVVWHHLANQHGAIDYVSPEAALNAAATAKRHNEEAIS